MRLYVCVSMYVQHMYVRMYSNILAGTAPTTGTSTTSTQLHVVDGKYQAAESIILVCKPGPSFNSNEHYM